MLETPNDVSVAVVGAGAIGTLLGHTLASAGHRVTMIDLPRRVAQIRRDGLRLVRDGTELRPATVHACDDPCGAPNADFVFLATKAYHLPLVAPRLTTLLSRAAAVVTVQNGIPWWYFYGHGGPLDGRRLTSLDPDGVLEAAIDARQIVGCVAYPAASMDAEGRVHHVEGDHFPLGELDGVPKERTTAIAELLKRAGFRSRVLTDLRAEIWLKAADRQAVADAFDQIEFSLKIDAHLKGQEHPNGWRVITVAPLAAAFRVSEEDRIVRILSVAFRS